MMNKTDLNKLSTDDIEKYVRKMYYKNVNIFNQVEQHNQTHSMCYYFLNIDSSIFKNIRHDLLDYKMLTKAMKKGIYLKDIPKSKRTEKIIMSYIKDTTKNILNIDDDEITTKIISQSLRKGFDITRLNNSLLNDKHYIDFIKYNYYNYNKIDISIKTDEFNLKVVKEEPFVIQLIPELERNENISKIAFNNDTNVMQYIKNDYITEDMYIEFVNNSFADYTINEIPKKQQTLKIAISILMKNKDYINCLSSKMKKKIEPILDDSNFDLENGELNDLVKYVENKKSYIQEKKYREMEIIKEERKMKEIKMEKERKIKESKLRRKKRKEKEKKMEQKKRRDFIKSEMKKDVDSENDMVF